MTSDPGHAPHRRSYLPDRPDNVFSLSLHSHPPHAEADIEFVHKGLDR